MERMKAEIFFRKKIRPLILKLLLLNLVFISPLSKNNFLLSENKNLIQSDYLRQNSDSNFYILGSGDTFSLKIVENDYLLIDNIDLVLDEVIIDASGYVSLPRLGRVYVSGLTINELVETLNKEYSKYINKPNVSITVVRYRPIKVYVDGEVEYPGLYVLKGAALPDNLLNPTLGNLSSKFNLDDKIKDFITKYETNLPTSVDDDIYFPTIIDVLRSAKGITLYANLSEIEIIRKNSISNGGGKIKTIIDLSEVINMRDQNQNIRVLDGDIILINKTDQPIFSQISKSIKTNINPRFIQIFLGGRVQSPGNYKVNTTATLSEALLIGGGTKFIKGKVVFLRYRNDGTIDRRKFKLNKKAKRGSYKNPFLKNGDIVFLEKSVLNRTSEVIGEITSPLKGIVSSLAFYKILTD